MSFLRKLGDMTRPTRPPASVKANPLPKPSVAVEILFKDEIDRIKLASAGHDHLDIETQSGMLREATERLQSKLTDHDPDLLRRQFVAYLLEECAKCKGRF